ncbi:hypothetical protein ACHAQH_006456 [Verticillium albo-atrum]
MINLTCWVAGSIAAFAAILILGSTSILAIIDNTKNGTTVTDPTMTTTTGTVDSTSTDEFGFYVFPTEKLGPQPGDYTQGSYDPSDSFTLHDLVYSGSAKDKIIRGFLVGCLIGLVLALCCCCWFPCFREGFNSDSDDGHPRPAGNRRARRAAAAAAASASGSNARVNNRQPREGPNGIELVNMAGRPRPANNAGQAVMSGALPADLEASVVAGPSTGGRGRSRVLARAMRNRHRND